MSSFRAQTREMFAKARRDIEAQTLAFLRVTFTDLVTTTPGPGLQYELTEYQATGRLRGGWVIGESAPEEVSRMTGGPTEDRGGATVDRLMSHFEDGLKARFQVWNEVAYGWYVYHGEGNHKHIGARAWVAGPYVRMATNFARSRVG